MKRSAGWVSLAAVALAASAGCFDFDGDYSRCLDAGRCWEGDGGPGEVDAGDAGDAGPTVDAGDGGGGEDAGETDAGPDAGGFPPLGLCGDGGYCWDHPALPSNTLLDVYATDAGELWVVGAAGLLGHLPPGTDGGTGHWQIRFLNGGRDLTSVTEDLDGGILVAGKGNYLRTFLGSMESRVEDLPTCGDDCDFEAVWSAAGTPGMVVVAGQQSGFARLWERREGLSWAERQFPLPGRFRAVHGTNAQNPWVVGEDGRIATSLPPNWNLRPQLDAGHLDAVYVEVGGTAWVGGTTLWKLSGTQQLLNSTFAPIEPGASIRDIVKTEDGLLQVASDDSLWMCSSTEVCGPSPQSQTAGGRALHAIGTQLYLAGEGGRLISRPDSVSPWIERYLPSQGTLYGVVEAPDGGVVAVGDYGTVMVRTREGWTRQTGSNDRPFLRAIAYDSDGRGWVASRNGLYELLPNGVLERVTVIDPIGRPVLEFTDIASTGDDVYAVGENALVAWRNPASGEWNALSTDPFMSHVSAVSPLGDGQAVAVSKTRTVTLADGGVVDSVNTIPLSVTDVFAVGKTEFFAVGAGTGVWTYGGANWTSSASMVHGLTAALAIGGRSADDFWVVGRGGEVSHCLNRVCRKDFTPADNDLRGVLPAADRTWFVGDHGAVLQGGVGP